MGSLLAGKKFYYCQNNGVLALATAETVKNMRRRRMIVSCIGSLGSEEGDHELQREWRYGNANVAERTLQHRGPIFTFCEPERYEKSPWFTGNLGHLHFLLDYIMKQGGECMDGEFYVPFSNGAEMGLHGKESLANELSYVVDENDVVATFGMLTEEINRRAVARGKPL